MIQSGVQMFATAPLCALMARFQLYRSRRHDEPMVRFEVTDPEEIVQ